MKRLLVVAGLALSAGPAFGQGNPLGLYQLNDVPSSGDGNPLGGNPLDGNAAFRSWIGQPKTVTGMDGSTGTMRFDADGTATRTDGVGAIDTGKWRHHELGFCSSWGKDAAGKERCYSVGTGNGQTFITLQGADGPAYYVKP